MDLLESILVGWRPLPQRSDLLGGLAVPCVETTVLIVTLGKRLLCTCS